MAAAPCGCPLRSPTVALAAAVAAAVAAAGDWATPGRPARLPAGALGRQQARVRHAAVRRIHRGKGGPGVSTGLHRWQRLTQAHPHGGLEGTCRLATNAGNAGLRTTSDCAGWKASCTTVPLVIPHAHQWGEVSRACEDLPALFLGATRGSSPTTTSRRSTVRMSGCARFQSLTSRYSGSAARGGNSRYCLVAAVGASPNHHLRSALAERRVGRYAHPGEGHCRQRTQQRS